jgi:hypothetical protein
MDDDLKGLHRQVNAITGRQAQLGCGKLTELLSGRMRAEFLP